MDTHALKCFMRLAEARSVDRAAASLHLSPRTLIRQVQALEKDIGAALFSRPAIGTRLTSAGESLLRNAYQIMKSFNQATEDVRRIGHGRLDRIDVGVFGTAMFNTIPEIQRIFCESHPGIEVVLHMLPKQQQLDALREKRIQIAFDRDLPQASDLEVELVAQEPIALALPQNHALARRETIRFSDFSGQQIIASHEPESPRRFRTLSQQHGFELCVSPHRSTEIMSGIALVAAGIGIIAIPASLQSIAFPNVAYRPLQTDLTADLHCAYLKGHPSPPLAAMLETVRAYRKSIRVHRPLVFQKSARTGPVPLTLLHDRN